ncbi:hypothetical protein FNU79_11915 [Deinococcus detaillensis]|uniref:Uncharacterized protein n=1 Tax=Deinococcus detaillensis TaxID=2592048 RepID=A0A553UU02_9DEIO|nr:hypothetical protein [Deinococcus detaillensis]TSA83706.1 hypothetical protein FNU79_11915 [Deinococcus detaillensis]
MDEGKPSSTPPASTAEAREMEALKDKTVPASDDKAYWQQTSDEGVQVSSQTAADTQAAAPAPGSIPEKPVTYGSLKDGMTPSGATTDPKGDAGKPKLGDN